MKLKKEILAIMARDTLKAAINYLEIEDVDRRSVEDMKVKLSMSRRADSKFLLEYTNERQVKEVCEKVGISSKGRRNALIVELLSLDTKTTKAPNSFIAIDFETANHYRNSACAVGIVKVKNKKIVKKAAYLIRPPTNFFSFTHIHGITWSKVKKKPTFDRLWAELNPLLKGVPTFVAHNAAFDRSVLNACCDCYGISPPEKPFICTVNISKENWRLKNYKLPSVCQRLGIDLDHHDPLSDAMACAQILLSV